MSHKTELLPRLDGESLTDWTLRFLADARYQLQTVQEDWKRREEDRRRMDDLYRACTPVEVEYSQEDGEEG